MSQVSRGFIWSAVERFSVQGISFILSIIIARIVSPSAYGLIVLVQVFLNFSQLFIDGGFANALIQKKDRNESDYCTVFIFNMVVAFILYILFFVTAPIIANYFNEPVLKSITRVISLNLIFSSLSIVQRTRLTINLDFKTQTKASIIAVVVSGVIGIVCAYCGMEVWALVIQGIINQFLISISLMYFSQWSPKPIFSIQSFRGLFSFGSKLMLTNVLTSIYINLTNLIIGKKYAYVDLGFYNRGFTLSQFPSVNICGVMNRVIYPILSQTQEDIGALQRKYLKYLHLNHFVIWPLMGILIVIAEPLIEVVLTSKWLGTVPFLRIFCLNFMLHPFLEQSSNPIAVLGHSSILLKFQIIKRLVSLIILLYTINISVIATCWGVVLSTSFECVVNLFLIRKEIYIGIWQHLKSQIDILLIVVFSCTIDFFVISFIPSLLLKLFVGFVLGVVLYICAIFIFNIVEKYYLYELKNSLVEKFKFYYNK